jgi:hypothetical protein
MRKSSNLVIAAWALVSSHVAAQESPPPIYVFGEEGTAANASCNADYASAIAAVSAALRYNRVPLATEQEFTQNRALGFYVNMNAQEDVMESGRRLESCGVALNLSLESIDAVLNPIDGRRYVVVIKYCERRSLLAWHRATMQSEINNKLRDYVDQCLAQYASRRLAG